MAQPALKSAEISARLSADLGRPLSSGAARMALFRARQLFAEFLVEEVRNSLDRPTLDDVEQELLDLQLLEYCRSVLERMRGRTVEVGQPAL